MTIPTLGPGAPIDVDRLIESRLLLQANSGGGKSWALRRILEQTYGKVQQIVLDPEGEFFTLREHGDYVLAGKHGGDCPAEPRGAALLARRLLELGVSAVLDIFELPPPERRRFVRLFLEAMVNAPRELWHPCLVVVDEAHDFCPETSKAESAGAVIDLMARGRKRGFCGILATQRIAKLSKDAAAEANNKLIGRSSLDVDMRRAADELGFSTKDDQRRLRQLEPGHFFAFGPALSPEVREIQVGPVRSSHPRAGQRATPPPPPREKVRGILAQLADLPREAEEEARSLVDARRRIAELEREVAAKPKPPEPPAPKVERVEVPTVTEAQLARLEKWGERYLAACAALDKHREQLAELVRPIGDGLHAARLARLERDPRLARATAAAEVRPRPVLAATAPRPPSPPRPRAEAHGGEPGRNGVAAPSSGGMHRMMVALAQRPGLNRRQLGLRAGLSSSGGTFLKYLGVIRGHGWLADLDGGRLELTDVGASALGGYEPLPEGAELRAHWLRELGDSGKARMLQALADAYPAALSREELAARCDMEASGGTFLKYLGQLRTLELVEGRSELRMPEELA